MYFSEAGNSFLDAYLAASQPVTSSAPSSASRPTRTRQRVVSKADFADAVKQTIAVLEQGEWQGRRMTYMNILIVNIPSSVVQQVNRM